MLEKESDLPEKIKEILREIKTNPATQGALIFSVKGILIASVLPSDVDERILAAICTGIINASRRLTTEIGLGRLKDCIIETQFGKVIINVVEDIAVIACLIDSEKHYFDRKPDLNKYFKNPKMKQAAEVSLD